MRKIFYPSILIIVLSFIAVTFSQKKEQTGNFKFFISVKDGRLTDGEKEFRFFSVNIPNLLLIEDDMRFESRNPWRLPNAFEIRDALLSVKQMGGKVARTYVISVKRPDDLPGTPKHVLAPGKFNERAFKVIDTTLAIANELGVRLIIPLMDNWKWMGGKGQYAQFRGKAEGAFWYDEQLKNDFKKTIAYILNRKNTVTGVKYKDDKAIMIWELGNELRNCPPEWIMEMAKFIKENDANHLVNDGIQNNKITKEILENPYIDVLSTHHYEGDPLKMIDHIKENISLIAGKKPYYLGEFGFISSEGIKAVLDQSLKNSDVCGALIWSLRFHNREGGFYWHSEPLGDGLYKAYHLPGFTSGNAYDETGIFKIFFNVNSQWLGSDLAVSEPPPAPYLLPVKDVGHISWRGSTGARFYFVERATSERGPWENISGYLTDADAAYEPLFNDEWAQTGQTYFYRVTAINNAGLTSVSDIAGPVKVSSKFLIDRCSNYSKLFQFKGKIEVKTDRNRSFKEDLDRLAGKSGAQLIYYVPGSVKGVKINSFARKSGNNLSFYLSKDGDSYRKVDSEKIDYSINQKDYNYQKPIQYILKNTDKGFRFFKIRFEDEAQIGRVEIEYEE
ncbi:MAG: hypothetical protein GXO77_12810 [Calditrichaeota bacterium]|nr:hypothetical protein [Calditrichota bacterium]